MWSLSTAQELVQLSLPEADDDDSDSGAYEPQTEVHRHRFGAVVGFLPAPQSLPLLIPETGNIHSEKCLSQAPDWDSSPDEFAHG